MRKALWLGVALMVMTGPQGARADDAATADVADGLTYPQTKTVDVVDTAFGIKIPDPYRWLEDDVRVNPAVADWVKAQNKVTDAYLDTLPGKDVLAARMKKLFDYERFGLPEKAGGHYFFTKREGLRR